MPFQVMHANAWHVQRVRQGLAETHSHDQRTGKPRPLGDRNCPEVGPPHTSLV